MKRPAPKWVPIVLIPISVVSFGWGIGSLISSVFTAQAEIRGAHLTAGGILISVCLLALVILLWLASSGRWQ